MPTRGEWCFFFLGWRCLRWCLCGAQLLHSPPSCNIKSCVHIQGRSSTASDFLSLSLILSGYWGSHRLKILSSKSHTKHRARGLYVLSRSRLFLCFCCWYYCQVNCPANAVWYTEDSFQWFPVLDTCCSNNCLSLTEPYWRILGAFLVDFRRVESVIYLSIFNILSDSALIILKINLSRSKYYFTGIYHTWWLYCGILC